MKRLFAVAMLLLCGGRSLGRPIEGSASTRLKETYAAGETLDFDLSWSQISGGAARMTILPIGEGRLRLTSVGKSGTFFSWFFRVRDEIESIVDGENFSTLQYHKMLDERGDRKDELTVIDERRHLAFRKGKSIAVPQPVFDPLSLIYYIRLLELTPGHGHEFTIIADGKVHTVRAEVVKRETITTAAGTFNTVVVEPKMEAKSGGVFRDEQTRLQIWYSDDARHLPVRIRSEVRIGTITAALRRVGSGVESVEPVTRAGQ